LPPSATAPLCTYMVSTVLFVAGSMFWAHAVLTGLGCGSRALRCLLLTITACMAYACSDSMA
jgi:hypothetical protein